MSDHTTNDIPYGYCHCGCGQRTPVAKRTDNRKGWIKGEPTRYCVGHANKGRRTMIVSERFWRKVDKRGSDECWEWTAAKSSAGYGQLVVEGALQYAHRLSYEMHHGAIPDSMYICHRCDNPSCVNPAHLFLGEPIDNVQDMRIKGRARGATRKLTESDALEIFALRDQDVPLGDIASRYGISVSSVCDIQKGRTWTHVTAYAPSIE